jgi:signal transduction histidine kinase
MVRITSSPATGSLINDRLLGLALMTIAPAVTLLAAAAVWPMWHRDAALAASVALLAAAFCTSGIVLLAEPGQAGPGIALLASAGLLLLSWSNEWGLGPLPMLSTVFGEYWLLTAGWALYRYPEPRLSGQDRVFCVLLAAWFTVVPWLEVLTSRPQWHDFPTDATWLPLLADRRAFDWVLVVGRVGLVAIGAAYVWRWVARLRAARPVERRIKTPPARAAIVAGVAAVTVPIGQGLNLPLAGENALYTLVSAAIVSVPAAFGFSVVRRHMARARITQLVLGVNGPPSTDTVITALRQALEDPDLDVAYWSDEHGGYVDEVGRLVPLPAPDGARLATRVESSAGAPLALVLADRALIHDSDLLAAAASVAGLALEVAHLLETIRFQLRQLREVSSRVVHAAEAERRRLEQDLHDGAQTHLLALGPMLGAAEAATTDPRTAAELAGIRRELTSALRELREFAHGMHQASLGSGLPAAVRDVCRPHPFTAEIALPDAVLPHATAHAAYLVICEAITNVAKHAQARHVRVVGALESDHLRIEVADDGRGGAIPNQGRGLCGIQDRVLALGGNVQVDSPAGRGTRITMRLPCA